MTNPLLPLEGHGPHGIDGGLSVLPFLGSFLLLLILVAALAGFYLWRHGRLSLPSRASSGRGPEEQAKQILADRFARGDISTDDFLERSSILNWTPGSEAIPPRRPGRKRRHHG